MKHLLLIPLLCVVVTASTFAQALRVYPVSANEVTVEEVDNSVSTTLHISQVVVKSTANGITVSFGINLRTLDPTQFLNSSGTPYSTVSAYQAKKAYEAAVAASGGGGGSGNVTINTTTGTDSTYTRTGQGYISAGTLYYYITNSGTTAATVNGISLPAGAIYRKGPATGKTHGPATYNGNGNLLYIDTYR